MIVIYRQISPSAKRVTAVAFPGSADTAQYVNLTGERILLRAAPASAGECSQAVAGPFIDRTIPAGSLGDADGGCWCCGPAGGSCLPSNKTGNGKAFLVSCFQ